MTKLSDTQLVLLSNAAKRADGALEPSSKLKANAIEKAVAALLSRKLISQVARTGTIPLWNKGPDDEPLSLIITAKGLDAIGVESDSEMKEPAARSPATKRQGSKLKAPSKRRAKPDGGVNKKKPVQRANSKIAKVVDLLRKPHGASIKTIMDATGWQAHSVRGAISGAIKKKLALNVSSEKRGDERIYRIGA